MKKVLTAVLLAAVIGFAGFHTANADWGRGGGRGFGPGSCRSCDQGISNEDQQARQDFFDATKDLREQLFDKRREYSEILSGETPDKEQAAAVWSEMYDLKAQLSTKAEAAGFTPGQGRGIGRGECDASGDCYAQNERGGRGRGYGRGCNGPRW